MTVEERYRERYKSGDTPWDVGQPDFNLIEVVTKKPILSCKVLDIACGTVITDEDCPPLTDNVCPPEYLLLVLEAYL